MKVAILIDELNAMKQLHELGVEGIRPWRSFYEALHSTLSCDYGNCEVRYYFYGAIPPKHLDQEKFYNRRRFFSALKDDGIHTQIGYCQRLENGKLSEKGVDVSLSLDLYDLSLEKYNLLFVFSADADLGPAIERAQRKGSKVVAILSSKQPAQLVKKLVDGVVRLEDIIDLIDESHVIRRKENTPNTTN